MFLLLRSLLDAISAERKKNFLLWRPWQNGFIEKNTEYPTMQSDFLFYKLFNTQKSEGKIVLSPPSQKLITKEENAVISRQVLE